MKEIKKELLRYGFAKTEKLQNAFHFKKRYKVIIGSDGTIFFNTYKPNAGTYLFSEVIKTLEDLKNRLKNSFANEI